MAGKTIKGITIEIDGKTTKLASALKEAESPARSLETNLKNVNKALKLDPTNTELLAEKQKILASYIDVTREKLETMESVQDQIRQQYANGEIDQGAYVEFQKELEYTKAKLQDLEKQQQEFGDTSKKALEEATKKCEDLEKNLKDVDAALKLDPTNITLLSEKQDILTDSIEATSEKLKLIKEQQDKISADYAAGNIDRGAYLDFQTELSKTEQKLKDLEKQQQEFGGVVLQVMQEAGEKVSDFGSKVSAAGDKISGVGNSLMPVTAAITAAGTAAVSFGSDMLESQNKVEVAFGDSADMVKKFADTTLDAYGIAEGSALDMAALFGDMATSMDLPQQAAAEMSVSLVGLAGDLASFKNIGLEEASNALKGIFTGETESLKNLGVVMTQDNLLRFAMQQGMIDTTKSAQQLAKEELALEKAQVAYNKAVQKYGENSLQAREAAMKVSDAEAALNESTKASLDTLSTAEMVQLRYAYVLNATTNAQGDFSRTSDGAANSMRVASEAVKELGADFGTLLAPYVAQIAQMISELIKYLISLPEETKKTILVVAALVAVLGPLLSIGGKLVSTIGSVISLIGKIPALITTVQGAFSALSGLLSGALTSAISTVGSALSGLLSNPYVLIIGLIIAAIAALVAAIVWLWNNCDGFRQFFIDLGDSISETWNNICESFQSGISYIQTKITEFGVFLGELGNSIASWAGETVNSIATFFSELPGKISTAISGTASDIAAWGANVKDQAVTAISSMVSEISSEASQVPGMITSALQGAITSVMSWGSNMVNAGRNALENVKNAISSGLERIKSLFNFEWSLPHIKLPHFYISGSFSLNPPSVPNFNVQWFAKGIILNGAQIFGAMGDTLLGGGEAGPEAVLPLSGFYDNLRSILTSFMGSFGNSSADNSAILDRLDGIYDRLGRLQVMMDTGTLVGEIVDSVDDALAAKQMLAERGV